jgi:hypothetical protein
MDTLLPAGPHLSNGCFERRAWESSGAAGQQGGGHRWEGTALALRAGGRYGTVEQQADWLRLGGQGREPTYTHSQHSGYQ